MIRNMTLRRTIRAWDILGETEPLWAILNDKNKTEGGWDLDDFFRTGEDEIARALSYLSSRGIILRSGSALDFGCGAGRLTRALGRRFERAVGLDAAPSMIALARNLNREESRCRFLLVQTGDLASLPDNSFDAIYSSITLQHMEPRYARRYIREFFRVLSPEGIMIFQIPSRRAGGAVAGPSRARQIIRSLVPSRLLSWYHRARYGKNAFIEMYGIPRREIAKLLVSCGAEIIGVEENRDAGDDWESFRYYARKP